MTLDEGEWNWSPKEKRIAHEAFDRALHLEKESAIRECKARVERIRSTDDIDDLWALEGWLRRRRRIIDERFDFRYSVLATVFADLLNRGQIAETDLEGLAPEKVERIRNVAQIFRDREAPR